MSRQASRAHRAAAAALMVVALLLPAGCGSDGSPTPYPDTTAEGVRLWNDLGRSRQDLASAQADLAQEAAVRRRQRDLDTDDPTVTRARSQVRALTDRREDLIAQLQKSALMASPELLDDWRDWRARAARLEEFRDSYYSDLAPLQEALAICEPLTAAAGRPAPGESLQVYARRADRRLAPLAARCLDLLDSLTRSTNPEIADYASRLRVSHRARAEMRHRLATGEADPRVARRDYTAWARDFNALRATFDPEPELARLDDAAQWRALAQGVRRVVAASGDRRKERTAGPYELD